MELNKKILKAGLILIVLSVIFTVGFALITKLDNPVFLKQYTEEPLFIQGDSYENGEFTLNYITNISDYREVTDIYFEEHPNLQFHASERGFVRNAFPMFSTRDSNRGKVYGRYILRTAYVRLEGRIGIEEFDVVELNNARINFSNGDILEADLGRIILYNHSNYGRDDFTHRSSRSSSDGTSSTTMMVNSDITITNIESPLLSEVHDLVELWVDAIEYKSITEIHHKKGDFMEVAAAFRYPRDILRKYTYYNLHPEISYRDSDGNLLSTRVYNVDYRNYNFSLRDILKYLRARGEI